MKTTGFNYRHLYFFWVVAKEGGVTRAAERLGLAVQTISTQLALLEKELGKSLLQPQGRRLVPTEAGRLALGYADQIFLLGEQMQEALADTDAEKMRLTVGISDSLPKLMAYRMLDATRSLDKPVKLVCLEDEFESLLADLALHKLDLVLTDRAVPAGASLRVSSHLWGESAMKLFAIPALAEQYRGNFPHSLHGAPFLLPARNNALRGRIDEWMVQQGVRPDVVGEFEDNAMLNAFGRKGLGLFFASASLAGEIEEQFGAVLVGDASSLREQFYVISNERKIMHPALDVILAAIQGRPKIHKET